MGLWSDTAQPTGIILMKFPMSEKDAQRQAKRHAAASDTQERATKRIKQLFESSNDAMYTMDTRIYAASEHTHAGDLIGIFPQTSTVTKARQALLHPKHRKTMLEGSGPLEFKPMTFAVMEHCLVASKDVGPTMAQYTEVARCAGDAIDRVKQTEARLQAWFAESKKMHQCMMGMLRQFRKSAEVTQCHVLEALEKCQSADAIVVFDTVQSKWSDLLTQLPVELLVAILKMAGNCMQLRFVCKAFRDVVAIKARSDVGRRHSKLIKEINHRKQRGGNWLDTLPKFEDEYEWVIAQAWGKELAQTTNLIVIE